MTGASAPPETVERAAPGRSLDVGGVVLCCAGAVLAAIVTVLLTPLYWGSVLVPVAVLLAVASNVAFPILARRLAGSGLVAAVPFVLWLVVVIALGTSRPEGDVLLPAGSGAQPWVTYGMLLAGGLAGGITLAVQAMPRMPAPVSDREQEQERR